MKQRPLTPETIVCTTIRDFLVLSDDEVVRELARSGGDLLGAAHWALVEFSAERESEMKARMAREITGEHGGASSASVRDASSPSAGQRQMDAATSRESPVRRCINENRAVGAEFHPSNGWYDAHGAVSLNAGVHHEYAFPLGDLAGTIGAIVWSRTHELPASNGARSAAEILAAAAGVRLGLGRSLRAATTLVAQLDTALSTRVVIEQAKGLVAGREGVDLAAAFDGLRGAARSSGRRLQEVAAEIVARRGVSQVCPASTAGAVSQPGTIARRTGRSQPG